MISKLSLFTKSASRLASHVLLFVSIIALGVVVSCKSQKFQNDLLPTSTSIIYEQALEVPQEYWFFKDFAGKSFIKSVIAQSMKDSLKACYPFTTKECTLDEVRERVQSVKHEISDMIFDEDWQLDTAQFVIKKHVRSYTLVRKYVRNTDTVKSLVATFNAPKTKDVPFEKLTLLASNVAYEVPLTNSENPEWVENMPRKRAMQLIIDKALSGEQAYSFIFRDTLHPLSLADIKLRLGEETSYEFVYNELDEITDTITINRTIDINEFVGLAFIEDWYYDKATMRLYKDVKAIAPVREYEKLLNDGYEKVRTIPLMMFFSNHKEGK